MKKAKSSTKKEKVLADIALSLGIAYLKRFTTKEINKYKNQPVVIQSGDYRFFVGPFVVEGLGKDCWKVTLDGRYIHNFLSKLNAILYCLSYVKDKYAQSNNILNWDNQVGNLTADCQRYEKHIKLATQRGDKQRKEILLNRYIEARLQQKEALANLKKTINSAKYNNFRNINNETN